MNTLLKKILLAIFTMALLSLAVLQWAPNTSAPDVTFTTIEGKKITMTGLKGKVVLVNFWATNCLSCIKEMPALSDAYRRYHQRGLEVIAVAMPDDPPARVLNYVKHQNLPFPVMHDGFAEIIKEFGHVDLTPTTFIFDKQGQRLQRTIGTLDFVKLDQLLNTKLANMEAVK